MNRNVFAVSLALLVAFAAGVRAGDEDERNTPAFKAYEKKLIKKADEIQEWVAKTRGEKYQAPVPKGVATESELKKALIEDFDKPENVKQAETEGQVARAFGLIPKDFDYRKEMRDLLADQIAGFYDPEAKRLRLVRKSMTAQFGEQAEEMNDNMVMAHELGHALQDQNFDLKRWEAILDGHNDREQALKCVVEGEATIIGFRYMFEQMGMPLPDMKTIWQMNNSMSGMDPNAAKQKEKMDALPAYLTRNLLMSYEEGSEFVEAVYNKGGWDAVSQLFREPPSSTAQVLHHKKYFEHVEPREISMPSVSKALKGTEIDQSTMGEANVRLILEGRGQKKKAARTIAAGWAGDRYQLYTTAEKKAVLVWLTTWEDEAKAQAFEEAYRAGLEKARPSSFSLERRGTEVLLVDSDDKDAREKAAPLAWLSAFDTGHMKPFPSMLEKPPLKDFTEADPNAGLAVASSVTLGPPIHDDELGFAWRLPSGWAKGDETIQQLKDFSRGYWKSKGAEVRIIDLPMPFDKDNLTQQFESFVRKGTKEFKEIKNVERQLSGRDAFEIEFEGIIPDGSDEKREARAIAVERDAMTMVIIISAKKGDLKAEIPGFDAAMGSFRWVPGKLAKEKTFDLGFASFAASTDFAGDSTLLTSKDGQATIRLISGAPLGGDIEKDRNEAERMRSANLKGYHSLGTSTFSHETLGTVYASDYEIETDGGKRRVHELAALVDGKRVVLTGSCAPEAYERWRPSFERAAWTLKLQAAAPKPEKKPENKKPASDDEPF